MMCSICRYIAVRQELGRSLFIYLFNLVYHWGEVGLCKAGSRVGGLK
jgi:hypothetical protein